MFYICYIQIYSKRSIVSLVKLPAMKHALRRFTINLLCTGVNGNLRCSSVRRKGVRSRGDFPIMKSSMQRVLSSFAFCLLRQLAAKR